MTKKDLLLFFKQNQHRYISGEEIASHFGITRAGIWKHIKSLQADGVQIDAVTNKGYKLCNSILSESEILANINLVTLAKFAGGGKISVETFDTIDSTNTYAKTKDVNGISLFCASEQTRGRGRRGNNFFSPAKTGIYFSLMFKPTMQKTTIFTVASAVAVCEVLRETFQKPTSIKWVNDIFLENRKVSGILTEGIFDLENNSLSAVIVGIGINLSTENFPEEIQNKAGALGANCNQNMLICKITERFFETLLLPREAIIAKYSALSMVLGKEISFQENGKTTVAIAKSFNSEGNLVCEEIAESENTQPITHTLKAGEISILGDFYL